MRITLSLLLILSLTFTSCDSGGDGGGGSEPGQDTLAGEDTPATEELTVCSCESKDVQSYCQEFRPKPGDDRGIWLVCGVAEAGCGQMGGNYGPVPCPTEDLVGSCFDDETDDPDDANTKEAFFYSVGGNPWDAAGAEDACEEDEVFNPAP